jgi:hypothetical protein
MTKSRKYSKKYDRKKREYTITTPDDVITIFRSGFGGDEEFTGISEKHDYAGGYSSFYQAIYDLLGHLGFKEYMKGRRKP